MSSDFHSDLIRNLAHQATARPLVPEKFKDCINGTWEVVDGRVNVNGNVDLSTLNLTRLPIKFGTVSGKFFCQGNRLTSLEGAPRSVGGSFDCSHNQLTTLEGAPSSVGWYFDCSNNPLTSLEGAPSSVGLYFHCNPDVPGLKKYRRRLRYA